MSQSKLAARLRLNLCWCTRTAEPCKHKKRNLNGGHDDFSLNFNIGCYCWSCIYSIEIFTRVFVRKYYETWWVSSNVEAWNFSKKTFKTCQLHESRLCICRLKSEHNYSEKRARKMQVLWIMLWKQGALNISMLRLWCCLPSPIKISGYAPDLYQEIALRVKTFSDPCPET